MPQLLLDLLGLAPIHSMLVNSCSVAVSTVSPVRSHQNLTISAPYSAGNLNMLHMLHGFHRTQTIVKQHPFILFAFTS